MRIPLRLRIKQISCLAVMLLTLWLGGIGCALCCSTGAGDHCCSSNQSACSFSPETEDDCCSLEKTQCASTKGSAISKLPAAGCSLLPNQTPVELRRSNVTSLLATVLPVLHFLPQPEIDERDPVFVNSVPPSNRGSTYLRCCVLLI